MDGPGLRLIHRNGSPRTWRRLPPLGLAGLILAAGSLATLHGADPARRPNEPESRAREALDAALGSGSDGPQVQEILRAFRRDLGLRPLDSRTRVAYASLVLALSSSVEQVRLAAFHARRAAELAPVTLKVTRSAALVLAHAGEARAAEELVRSMFDYEPDAAADLLAELPPLAAGPDPSPESSIPDTPEAWMAWYRQLRDSGSARLARKCLDDTHARWPEDPPALEELALVTLGERDWQTLASLLPDDAPGPAGPDSAPLLVARARLEAERGELGAARAHVDEALRLRSDAVWLRMLAADVYEALGAYDTARAQWNRALRELPPGEGPGRPEILTRLARLEDRAGEPALALRLWRRVLEIEPDHEEARRRADDLSGFER